MTESEVKRIFQRFDDIERKLYFQNEWRIKRLEENLKGKEQKAWSDYCEAKARNDDRAADVCSGEYIAFSEALGTLYRYYSWLVEDKEEEGEE
jgi:hypothetical protein